jgi:hypothetical protein
MGMPSALTSVPITFAFPRPLDVVVILVRANLGPILAACPLGLPEKNNAQRRESPLELTLNIICSSFKYQPAKHWSKLLNGHLCYFLSSGIQS